MIIICSCLHQNQGCHVFLALVKSLKWSLTGNLTRRVKGKRSQNKVRTPTSGSGQMLGLRVRAMMRMTKSGLRIQGLCAGKMHLSWMSSGN